MKNSLVTLAALGAAQLLMIGGGPLVPDSLQPAATPITVSSSGGVTPAAYPQTIQSLVDTHQLNANDASEIDFVDASIFPPVADGQFLRGRYAGDFTAVAPGSVDRRIRAYLGTFPYNPFMIFFDSGALTPGATAVWSLDFVAIRVDSQKARIIATFTVQGLATLTQEKVDLFVDWTAIPNLFLRITGQATGGTNAAGAVRSTMGVLDLYDIPHP